MIKLVPIYPKHHYESKFHKQVNYKIKLGK